MTLVFIGINYLIQINKYFAQNIQFVSLHIKLETFLVKF